MKTSSALYISVLVAIAGLAGFYAGNKTACSEIERLLTDYSPNIVNPPVSVKSTTWEISEHTDRMDDSKSYWLTVNSTSGLEATLQISCDSTESISIYSDRFFTHDDGYYVTYRVDKRRANTFTKWHSITSFATPPDESKFISELAGGNTLIVDIFSPGITTYTTSFNITGYDRRLAELREKCGFSSSSLPTPLPES